MGHGNTPFCSAWDSTRRRRAMRRRWQLPIPLLDLAPRCRKHRSAEAGSIDAISGDVSTKEQHSWHVAAAAVELEDDTEGSNRDRYDRLLRYVYLPDGAMLNALIIEEGHGVAYTKYPFSRMEKFRKAPEEGGARRARALG